MDLREEDNDVCIRPTWEANLYNLKLKQINTSMGNTNRHSILPNACNFWQTKSIFIIKGEVWLKALEATKEARLRVSQQPKKCLKYIYPKYFA